MKQKRYVLFAALAALTAIFQHTPGFRLEVFSLAPMLLVPLTVAVAMHERADRGLLFGLFAGLLWDFASSGADGMYTLMLATIGFGVGILITFIMRNTALSAFILSFVSCLAVSTAYWLIFIFRKGYDGMFSVLWSFYLPCAVYSSLFIFLYHYLVSLIIKGTGVKKTYIK